MFKLASLVSLALVGATSLRSSTTVCTQKGGQCYLLALQYVAGCGINDGKGTIHGLWPEWGQTCTTEAFNATNLASIRSEMDIYWPTCVGTRGDVANEGFWNHEWSKHGVCSGMSQLDFFSTTLTLAKKVRADCTIFTPTSPSLPGECHTCFDRNLEVTEECSSSSTTLYFKSDI